MVSSVMVDKLNLKCEKHPYPYHISWFKKGNEVTIDKIFLINFSIGNIVCTQNCMCYIVWKWWLKSPRIIQILSRRCLRSKTHSECIFVAYKSLLRLPVLFSIFMLLILHGLAFSATTAALRRAAILTDFSIFCYACCQHVMIHFTSLLAYIHEPDCLKIVLINILSFPILFLHVL